MVSYLNKYFEADEIAKATVGSGTLLIPGTANKDYIIPDGKTWSIYLFGGNSSVCECELQLLYSEDGGNTWSNPFDDSAEKLACIHVDCGYHGERHFTNGFEFTGSGTDIILRLLVKNYNTESIAEIVSYIEGMER